MPLCLYINILWTLALDGSGVDVMWANWSKEVLTVYVHKKKLLFFCAQVKVCSCGAGCVQWSGSVSSSALSGAVRYVQYVQYVYVDT